MRRMSFALTVRQLLDGSKTVTRRLGWADLKPGDRLLAVRKCQGLKRGERQVVLGEIEVKAVKREALWDIRWHDGDCVREGFPQLDASGFVRMFCEANRCTSDVTVTRIELRLVRRIA